jgi:ABC-type nickel/cobalt efflux system permease component RcnA
VAFSKPIRLLLLLLVLATLPVTPAWPHDIPNERIDRSIQVSLSPGLIAIDYEVSLTELTLTQDLRRLIGSLPGADRQEWLARYGQETGPLNAKGVLVTVDGQPVTLSMSTFDLAVEDHPRYTFHLKGELPGHGRMRVRDTNYVSSEGTSRLGIRGLAGVVVEGDRLPGNVEEIEIRPVWALSDQEERRTKQVDVRFRQLVPGDPAPTNPSSPAAVRLPGDSSAMRTEAVAAGRLNGQGRLYRLLDDSSRASWLLLLAGALALGAAHAIQPGHGTTLVTAVALGPDVRIYQPAVLALSAATAHVGSVLLIAAVLGYTGATKVGTVHEALTKIAGFVIGAAGLWRVGRALGGYVEHDGDAPAAIALDNRGLIGLGLAGGIVPCWEAIALLVLAAAVGKLAAGVALVLAFSAGMAIVLVSIGILAWKLKSTALGAERALPWQRPLGLTCGAVLSAIGFYMFFQ